LKGLDEEAEGDENVTRGEVGMKRDAKIKELNEKIGYFKEQNAILIQEINFIEKDIEKIKMKE
jgi:hypothetical protein